MTNTIKIIAIGIAGIVVGLILSAVIIPSSNSFGGVYELTARHFTGGFYAGQSDQFSVTDAGVLSITSTGTTTPSFTSSSATQGVCMQFNATSTNTLLNLTFAATTTQSQASGVGPVVKYGACL